MARTNGSPKSIGSLRFLPCQAEPGMFKGEFLVYLHGLNPERGEETITVQMLVDERDVKGLERPPKRNNPEKGWVQVSLLFEKGGVAEVILPQPAQPVGQRLFVHAGDLKKDVRA
jgi:hypothetical protein